MRARAQKNGVTVNAVAGTRVVFLGLDLVESKRAGCMGFAIQRRDPAKDETVWLRGKKTFAATDPGVGPGADVPTFDHPVQGFWWADYEVSPGSAYTYTVVPRYGTPAQLTSGPSASVDVTTEVEVGETHSVFFNRGSVASQEYARDFQDVPPSKLKGDLQAAAYRYLSHGLFEALIAFIARAEDKRFSLRCALYEFNWLPVLQALGDASKRGADVAIIYDAIHPTKPPATDTVPAVGTAGISDLCLQRTHGTIMHNKFLVLSQHGKPVAVWTGSTNISENGIFGHLNVGHFVDDPDVASAYLTYWQQLSNNALPAKQKAWVDANDPVPKPAEPWTAPITPVFSPHPDDAVLDRYAAIAGSASDALCMTFAFGMDDVFKTVYRSTDHVLRMALMEDYGSGRQKKAEAQEIKATIQPLGNVVVAIGGAIPLNGFDAWVAENQGIGEFVQWVHTKFMLVDPLSDDPTVITGSANFSTASTQDNDENMLVIRGDTRVADIYFTEFMRLFAHYGFRESVAIAIARHEDWHPGHLLTDSAAWLTPYVTAGDDREVRRRYFSTGKTS